jgi:hypothetical protein
MLNIEVDGPWHLLPIKQRLKRLRGQHLQEACGVRIVHVADGRVATEWRVRGGGARGAAAAAAAFTRRNCFENVNVASAPDLAVAA